MPRAKRNPPKPELAPLSPPVYPINWALAGTDQAWMRVSYGLRCADCPHEVIVTGESADEAWKEIHKVIHGWQALWTADGFQLFCPRCATLFEAAGLLVVQRL